MVDSTQWWVRAYRIGFALLAITAIVVQATFLSNAGIFKPGNFFSFFTIQSNIIALIVLLWGGRGDRAGHSAPGDRVRGAATTYMTITGIVYGVLLSGLAAELQTQVPWVDFVLHRLMPIVMLADWLLVPPRNTLNVRQALVWLIYPVLYAVYSLVRGLIVDWYPYPFLDPRIGGYGRVGLFAIGIAIGAFVFVWLIVLLGNRVRLIRTAVA